MIIKKNCKCIRKRSNIYLFGLPLIDIAFEADLEQNKPSGQAFGIIAIEDIAKGYIAIGGIASGLISIGGISLGIFSLGGLSIGLLTLGVLSIWTLACGGLAIGVIDLGGCSIGYYAIEPTAFGEVVFSSTEQTPEIVYYLRKYVPYFFEKLKAKILK